MHPLEKKIDRIIRSHTLVQTGETVVVGVSGGPDSMALLHVLTALKIPCYAIYVDHGLRPKEIPEEISLVTSTAHKLGISCEVVEADVKGLAKKEKLSLEHAARTKRYEIFTRTADATGATKIAVGHTADDQAEEMLLRLIRGTARKGLSGMERLTENGVIRPFLDIPKQELLAYLQDRQIPFMEDSSNQDRRFLRNKIRLDLLPYLEEHFHTGIRGTLRRTANILAEEEAYLAETAKFAFQRVVAETSVDECSMVCDALLAEPLALQRRIIEQVLIDLQTKPSGQHIADILKLAGNKGKNGSLHLAQGLRIEKKNGQLSFAFPRGRSHFRGDR